MSAPPRMSRRVGVALLLGLAAVSVAGLLVWQGMTSAGAPDPLASEAGATARVLDIAVLVFREGLECILVLAAITASRASGGPAATDASDATSVRYQHPIAIGAAIGFLATLVTWAVAVGVVDNLTESVSALNVQAATGLVAVIVLVVVMNWFFHKLYWTGWIGAHNRRKRTLLGRAKDATASQRRVLVGLGLLGFTSLYREGFEVVLFLQNYRLRLGGRPVLYGVAIGVAFSSLVAILTFVANRRLPYRKMLVLTGALLTVVLLVMVGEQAQEMQLAGWLPTTAVASLAMRIPAWMGLWCALFPTVETLSAQALAAELVLGSYGLARVQVRRSAILDAARGTD
ncbi:MAG: iron permease [Gemmatimonadota bacterium]|nr:iron permease [Gemmatimonadota bacterium]